MKVLILLLLIISFSRGRRYEELEAIEEKDDITGDFFTGFQERRTQNSERPGVSLPLPNVIELNKREPCNAPILTKSVKLLGSQMSFSEKNKLCFVTGQCCCGGGKLRNIRKCQECVKC